MMNRNLYPIHREGWRYLGYSFGAFILFMLLDMSIPALLSLVSLVFLAYVFKNPERITNYFDDNSVVSPVDGRVLAINNIDDGEFGFCVEVLSSYTHTPALRVPFIAKAHIQYRNHGARLSRFDTNFERLNDSAEILFQNGEKKLKVVHRCTQDFEGLHIEEFNEKAKLMQGTRYGVMLQGVTYIYFPKDFRVNTSIGAEIRASETLLGYFA
ncbi:MAG: hypothetical protein IE916_01150 [Epsilonproteobacteria bacterium]|nr:hypothetical protein [Campylobacterota bacterium]